jgi:hypothetical protein
LVDILTAVAAVRIPYFETEGICCSSPLSVASLQENNQAFPDSKMFANASESINPLYIRINTTITIRPLKGVM